MRAATVSVADGGGRVVAGSEEEKVEVATVGGGTLNILRQNG